MYIDSSQSNYFQRKKSKGEKTKGQIKDKRKSGKRVETQRSNAFIIVDPSANFN